MSDPKHPRRARKRRSPPPPASPSPPAPRNDAVSAGAAPPSPLRPGTDPLPHEDPLVAAVHALSEPFEHGDWFARVREHARHATTLRDRAAAGADLTPHLPVILDAYRDANQMDLLQPLIDTLVFHFLLRADPDGLADFLRGARFESFVLDGIRHADERGIDITPALPAVLQARDGLAAANLLARLAARDPRRVGPLAKRLSTGRPDALPKILGSMALSHSLDITDGLPDLAGRLADPDARARASAARTFRLAAESNSDLTATTPALERALADAEEEVRVACAHSLAFFRIVRPGGPAWEGVDRLRNDPDPAVRAGALGALGTAWGSRDFRGSDTVSRIARSLRDESAQVRKRAAGLLLLLERRGGTVAPDGETLRALAQRLGDRELAPAIADYLSALASRGPAETTRVREAVLDSAPPDAPAARRLTQAVEPRSGRPPIRACSICKHIPRRVSTNLANNLPPHASRLEAVDATLRRCPECAAWYRFACTIDYDVIRADETCELERLAPHSALAAIPPDRRAEEEARNPGRMADARAGLDHLEEWIRRESAWILTAEAAERNNLQAAQDLLSHGEADVREEAAATLAAADLPGAAIERLAPTLTALEDDPRLRTRESAAYLLARWRAGESRWQEVAAMIRARRAEPVAAALRQVHRAAEEGRDVRQFLEHARSALRHADPGVRTIARRTLTCLQRNRPLKEDLVREIAGRLERGTPEERTEAACTFLDLAKARASIESALPALAAALADEAAGWHALSALAAAVKNGADGAAAIPPLAAALSRGHHASEAATGAILDAAVTRRWDTAPLVAAFVRLLDGPDRQTAVIWLHRFAESGADLRAAEEALARVAAEDADGFHRQEAARALIEEYLRSRRWSEVERMLLESRHDVRGIVCARLEDAAHRRMRLSRLLPALVRTAVECRGYTRDAACAATRAAVRQSYSLAQRVLALLPAPAAAENPALRRLAEACRAIPKRGSGSAPGASPRGTRRP